MRAKFHDESDSKEDVAASWAKEIERRVYELEQGKAELLDREEVNGRVFLKLRVRQFTRAAQGALQATGRRALRSESGQMAGHACTHAPS